MCSGHFFTSPTDTTRDTAPISLEGKNSKSHYGIRVVSDYLTKWFWFSLNALLKRILQWYLLFFAASDSSYCSDSELCAVDSIRFFF